MTSQESINVTYRRNPHGSTGGQHIATMARATLIRFSKNAARHLPRNPQHRNYGISTDAPKSAVQHVLDWMIDQAANQTPAPLPHPDTFEEAVWALQVCRTMGVFKSFMGEAMRDEVWAYIRMAPLTWQEFAMIYEVIPFDTALMRLAVVETEKRFREGGLTGVPDVKKIVEYCVENEILINIALYEVDPTRDDAKDWEVSSNPGKTPHDELPAASNDVAVAVTPGEW